MVQRITNLPRDEWTDQAREIFAFWGEPGAWDNGSKTNMQMVMAQHPPLPLAYNIFGKHLLLNSTLPVRPRELVVLRCAWHQKCEYEWHYHIGYGLTAGLTMAEMAAVREGPDAPEFAGKDEDRAVLRAVDELVADNRISDATWAELSHFFSKQQIMDFVFTVGNYVMLGWAVASFGIPVEDGVDPIGFDMKARSGKDPQGSHRPFEKEGAA
jgi:4-carboxymuconolactone decarboxylase